MIFARYEITLARLMVFVEWVHFLSISSLSIYLAVRYSTQLGIYLSKSHPFFPIFIFILMLFISERCVSFGATILVTKAIYQNKWSLCDNWFCIQKCILKITIGLALVNFIAVILNLNGTTIIGSIFAIIYRIFSLKVILDFMKVLQMEKT